MNSKLPKYPTYKPSGMEWLGDIPEHWKLLSLKRVILSNDGGVWNENISEEGVAVYRSTEINVDGTWNSTPPIRLELKEKELLKSLLKYNDLIVTKSSGSSEHIGKTAIYKKNEIAAYSNFMQRIRFNSDFYNPDFYFYVLNSNISKYQYQVLTKSTSGLGNLNGEILNNLITIAPPFIEQTLIASFLHRKITLIDQAIGIKLKQIDLLKERRQILIHRAVTRGLNPDVELKDSGVEWIGEIPEHWEVKALKYIANLQSGETISAEKFVEEGFPVFGGNGFRGYASSYTNDGEFALIGRQGALCGNVNYAKGKFFASEHAIVVYPINNESFLWLGEAIKVADFNRLSQSAAQPGIAVSVIKNVLFPYPPISEQFTIAKYIGAIYAKISKAISLKEQEIEKLKEYKASLINEVVTGKVKVFK